MNAKQILNQNMKEIESSKLAVVSRNENTKIGLRSLVKRLFTSSDLNLEQWESLEMKRSRFNSSHERRSY